MPGSLLTGYLIITYAALRLFSEEGTVSSLESKRLLLIKAYHFRLQMTQCTFFISIISFLE